MISLDEFYKKASDPRVREAREKIRKVHEEADFMRYSFDEEVVERILGASLDSEELKFITHAVIEANATKKEITTILKRMERKQSKRGVEDFFDSIRTGKNRLFVLLGETGVGKSYMVEKEFPKIPKYACNKQMDAFSLCFFYADKGDGMKPYPTPFLEALKNGGTVFLDEMNELPLETLMLIQGIADEKKDVVIGDEIIPIKDGFKIIAAMNPPSATDERSPLGDALIGRSVGFIMTLTEELIAERIGRSVDFVRAIKRLYHYVFSSMEDVRPLDFRDYQKIARYGVDQIKFRFCVNDINNISAFERLAEMDEFLNLIDEIERLNVDEETI